MSSSAAGPLRRSSRLRNKENTPNLVAVPVRGSEEEKSLGPPTKRRRKNTSKSSPTTTSALLKSASARGKRKSLSKLPDMPLDILYEVFAHLHPYDLLHLARTTKAFRSLLMSRSSITLWRQSIATVPDLPECPPDLTEPAYANLLFDPHCHFCVKARVMTVMWTCRLRCCKPCLKDNFAELIDVFLAVGPKPIKPGAMLPAEQINNRLFFPKSKLQELLKSIAECDGDVTKLKALEEQHIQLMTDQERSAELLEDWQAKQNHKRALEKLDLRVRRQTQCVHLFLPVSDFPLTVD
uniref:F-box domain protein n=1 Tax=Ganoderma boninense TaxID=34458 RepID=A0A5K1JSJ9_9APHY|nr:F-box domain protein [Ganoderma boninense]